MSSKSQDPLLKRASDIESMCEYWEDAETVLGGVRALTAAKEKHLPKFDRETASAYKSRLKLTAYTNIYRDIIDSLSSKPFENEVQIIKGENAKDLEPPQDIVDFCEDVNGAGDSLTTFAADVFFHGIHSAVDWILVDFPTPDRSFKNRAEERAAGLKPYWVRVSGQSVLEVRCEIINGEECLTYVRYLEDSAAEKRTVRIFNYNTVEGVSFEIWEEQEDYVNKTAPAKDQTKFKMVNNGSMKGISRIPMVAFATGRRKARKQSYLPVMTDVIDMSLRLFRSESGLEYAKTLSAYPMLTGNGVKPEKNEDGTTKELVVGPGHVLYAPPQASGGAPGNWAYVEPNSQSLIFLEGNIEKIKREIRELGRQPLTAQTDNLTVVTTQVAASKARSAVQQWALNLKNTLEKAISFTMEWKSIADGYKPQVYVYTEFDTFIDGKDLDALIEARKNGDMSHQTFMEELKRRGVLSPEYNHIIELSRLLADTTTPEQPNEETDP